MTSRGDGRFVTVENVLAEEESRRKSVIEIIENWLDEFRDR